MKNVIKFGFLVAAFGIFAVACGGNAEQKAVDSTATEATQAIDSAANAANAAVAATADSAKAAVDSAAAAAVDTAAKH
ncbi:hypothetical protein [Chitinophaga sp. CB10]|uniref:hypothetical protein n=1 Tax=Chitinophaga sp. CB10 TaxID=1891659 RepID=UPI0025C2BD58|nr:hypothetical protein [Chitinophaga sp. CB10]